MFGSVRGQEEQRRVETFLDNHGREYVANVEVKTGDPCDVLRPIDWKAPIAPDWFAGLLTPPEPFRKMVPRHLRARKRYQIEIDYVAWLAQWDERMEGWNKRVHDLARGMSSGVNFIEIATNPPPVLLDYVGARPFPPRILIEAMAAGNAWALGFTDKIPSKVEALLTELRPQITHKVARRHEIGLVDPLAEDGAEGEFEDRLSPAAPSIPDPFGDDDDEEPENAHNDELDDRLSDLDDAFDPDALGGTTTRVGRVKSAKGGRKPRT